VKYEGQLGPSVLSDPNNTHARVLRLVGRGKRVLEIGCATGYMTQQMIREQGCRVTAFEIDSQAASMATVTGATVLIGDVEETGQLERAGGISK